MMECNVYIFYYLIKFYKKFIYFNLLYEIIKNLRLEFFINFLLIYKLCNNIHTFIFDKTHHD